jgi:hypothetical protein
MPRNDGFELGAIVVGTVCLLLRAVAPLMGGSNRWQDITPEAIAIFAVPVFTAFVCLLLGRKLNQRIVGLIGFLGSALFLPIIPAVSAYLVILYTVSKKPLILTSVWAGIAALITAIPFVFYRFSDRTDLMYASSLGMIMATSWVSSIVFFLISAVALLVHLVKRVKAVLKARQAPPGSRSV